MSNFDSHIGSGLLFHIHKHFQTSNSSTKTRILFSTLQIYEERKDLVKC